MSHLSSSSRNHFSGLKGQRRKITVKRGLPSRTQLHPRGWLLLGWGSRASAKRKVIVMKPRCQFYPPDKPTTLTSHKSSCKYCTESGFGGLSHPWRSRPWYKWLWLERKSSIYNWATLGVGGDWEQGTIKSQVWSAHHSSVIKEIPGRQLWGTERLDTVMLSIGWQEGWLGSKVYIDS